ncbi:MAG: sigma-70 region 4 domain-containing protein [Hyphomonadaceae bacterium]
MQGIRLQRAMAALDAMPLRRRQAFLMHRVEGRTYVEIARRLGMNIRSVEEHVMLAIRDLAREIG